MPTHAHHDAPITPGVSLIHDAARDDRVQFENVLVGDRFNPKVLLHVTQAGEIVENLALGTLGNCGQRAAFLQLPDLLQGEWITFDGG